MEPVPVLSSLLMTYHYKILTVGIKVVYCIKCKIYNLCLFNSREGMN